MESHFTLGPYCFCRRTPDPDRQGQTRRGAFLGRCQSSSHLLGRQGARRSSARGARLCLFAHRRSGKCSQCGRICGNRFRARRSCCRQWQADVSRGAPRAFDGLGRAHGVGRLDLVENRFVGMKSRGMYETPGGTILYCAHRGIEQITLDRGAAHLKDELMPRYAELIYNGFWFSPEREMLQALIDRSQEFVTGRVRLKLYKGSVSVAGRSSPYSLYDQDLVTFEEGATAYDHRDAEGFIKLNALRLRTLAKRNRKAAGGKQGD